MKRIAAVLLALALASGILAQTGFAAQPQTSAASAILMEAASGRVLYAQNIHEQRLIASITKLMTALVAAEHHPQLQDVVRVRREWTGIEGSSMYLRPDEELTLEALLYGLLLVSGNDAAEAVAGFCAEDRETFVCWMNEKAAQLGMKNSHFSNPSGLNQEEHYSSAYDMALLGRAVMENEALAKIVSTRSIQIAGRSLTNHNKLLWRCEGCTGMKTGYTERAGRTLVSCAERNGLRLIAVTLSDRDDWKDHVALYDYGFSAVAPCVLAQKGTHWGRMPISGSLSSTVAVGIGRDLVWPLMPGDRTECQLVWTGLPAAGSYPTGTEVGRLEYRVNGAPIGVVPLVLSENVTDDRAPLGLWDRWREKKT